jgi:hypothetical protein
MRADYLASTIVPVVQYKLTELNAKGGNLADEFFQAAKELKAAGADVGVPASVVDGVTCDGVLLVKIIHATDNFSIKCAAYAFLFACTLPEMHISPSIGCPAMSLNRAYTSRPAMQLQGTFTLLSGQCQEHEMASCGVCVLCTCFVLSVVPACGGPCQATLCEICCYSKTVKSAATVRRHVRALISM